MENKEKKKKQGKEGGMGELVPRPQRRIDVGEWWLY